ncbi:MAG: hypothetical protein R3C58_02260 [Parvularculaceae bacterium]
MDVTVLRSEISAIQEKVMPRIEMREEHHQKLFEVFRNIEASLGELSAATDAESDARAEGLIEAQTVVVRTAATLPARTMKDLLYKLAIWRWDAPELDRPVETMTRSDAVAYTAFRDLAHMLGVTEVLKDFDKTS